MITHYARILRDSRSGALKMNSSAAIIHAFRRNGGPLLRINLNSFELFFFLIKSTLPLDAITFAIAQQAKMRKTVSFATTMSSNACPTRNAFRTNGFVMAWMIVSTEVMS